MPELPEVETVKRGLDKLINGRTVCGVSSDWEKSFPNPKDDVKQFLIGAKIIGVRRRAKVLLIDLSSEYSLVIHLKMTGQLVYRAVDIKFGAGHPSSSLSGRLPDKSTRVVFNLDKGQLFFNDQRKFGWVKLLPSALVDELEFFKKLGPEPLEPNFSPDLFIKRIRSRPKSRIKPVLMDQSVIAGVGNIYADEALWGAKIHPETIVGEIKDEQLKNLHRELIYVLKLSIKKGGSTDRNYVSAEGKKGSYLQFARVFRKQNRACPRCGEIIIKLRVAGRGTHICPYCQIKS